MGSTGPAPAFSSQHGTDGVMPTPVPAAASDTGRWTQWDRFVESASETGFMQSSWWADFRATVGYEHFGLALKDHGAIVAGALVLKYSYAPGRCFYYVQDGPVLPDDESVGGEVFETILDALEERRQSDRDIVSHLRIEPRWQRLPGFVRGFQTPAFTDRYTEPRKTRCVDLRPSGDAILAQMRPKGRYNVRLAERHGVSVVEDTSERGLADFLRIYRRTATRKGIGTKPASYFRALVSLFTPLQRVSIFFAEYNGRRLATALVVYFGRRATYFFGGSFAQYRRVMAPYLLHFEIMRNAKALGCEWYDFWGVAPENEPDHPLQDISAFKRKFGGVEVNLVPTLDRVYDPSAYDEYAVLSGASKRELTDDRARWALDKAFDLPFGTDTSDIVPLESLAIASEHKANGVSYEPTPTELIHLALRALPINHEEYSFVDFGSGKGRVLIAASQYPFANVIGVEFSPELHATAVRNIESVGSVRMCRAVRSLCIDAARFPVPAGNLVLYFFNPFDCLVFEKIIDNLKTSVKPGVEIIIIYCQARCKAVVENCGLVPFKRQPALPFIASRRPGWIRDLVIYSNIPLDLAPVPDQTQGT